MTYQKLSRDQIAERMDLPMMTLESIPMAERLHWGIHSVRLGQDW